jgi:hypothetical protein
VAFGLLVGFHTFIYFSSLYVSGIHVPIIRRKLLYLCDAVICHSVWVVSGLLVGFHIFIYFSSLHISGIHLPIIRRKLLYLCDIEICHSVLGGVWYADWISYVYFFFNAAASAEICAFPDALSVLAALPCYLSICMGGVWSAGWFFNPTTRPEATHTE